MESLAQSFKIGLGLLAFVAGGLLLAPQPPTLLTVRNLDAKSASTSSGERMPSTDEAGVDETEIVASIEPDEPQAPPQPEASSRSDPAPAVQSDAKDQDIARADAPAGVQPEPADAPAAIEPAASEAEDPGAERGVGGEIAGTGSSPAPTRTAALERRAPTVEEAEEAQTVAPQPLSLQELTAEPAPLDLQLFHRPVVADATTLDVDDASIRIAGVKPLPADATCSTSSGPEPCGAQARTAVRAWLRGRSVLCSVPTDRESDGAMVAPCLAGEEDVGEWIVANGWAQASRGSRYKAAEERARAQGLGIWSAGSVEIATGD